MDVTNLNAIEINGLKKNYRDFNLELSLALPRGCIMGLVGENGAGKSTTIKCILGMVEKDAGTIKVLGQDTGGSYKALKEQIGVVMDEPPFPEGLTARQIGRVMAGIFKSWDSAVYHDYMTRFSLPLNKCFKEFSRGMKMKLSIAAALSHHPALLILDEPSSGLDPLVRDEVMDIFSEFTRDESHSILISSHIVSDLEKICDYIAFIHKGRLMLCEEKDELLNKFCFVRCAAEELENIGSEAVIGRKRNPYGVSAIVRREAVPAGMKQTPVSIEELFVFMTKEA